MNIRKMIYLIVGCISLALGALGAIMPLLPAFPFLLLATCCFAKSSDRLHQWFTQTKLYQNNLESYVQGKGMSCTFGNVLLCEKFRSTPSVVYSNKAVSK